MLSNDTNSVQYSETSNFEVRDVSLFSGGGRGYQFFKRGSQKILTLLLNTNKKIVTLPPAIGKKKL